MIAGLEPISSLFFPHREQTHALWYPAEGKQKHTSATMAKDKNRARRKLARLLPGFGLTPQMALSASCN
jgi:hypothetical protein